MKYRKRVADQLLADKMKSFGGVLIEGVKGCGKTTTAKQFAKSIVEFEDEDVRDNLLQIASIHPSDLLKGEKPRLFDEWQDAPKIWGAIRKSIDDEQLIGAYILTGSSSNKVRTPHTGTLRIDRMKMYPMSLYESGDSNGQVSLRELFDHPDSFSSCQSDLDIDHLKYVICRGGWPSIFNIREDRAKLRVAESLFRQTCEVDISNIDDTTRDPERAKQILRSYGRNLCTLASKKTILADVSEVRETSINTLNDYIEALEKLNVICDVNAWNPAIRSKTAIRSSVKRNLVDPSVAAAALGIGPDYLSKDYQMFGFLFESLCLRDLKIYSEPMDGEVSYYHDRNGLEADAVVHLGDGRFALAEVKLGGNEIEKGAENLNKIEELIRKHNSMERQNPMRLPDLKIVLTGTQYGFRRDDGVFVIPIGCLKD